MTEKDMETRQNKDQYRLLPFAQVDGISTMTDSQIMELYRHTEQDGLIDVVFYDGSIQTEKDFLSMVKAPGTVFYVFFEGLQEQGYVWLNRFEGRGARIHFCGFKHAWGRALPMGQFCVDFFTWVKDLEGNFLFDLLMGITPAENIFARAFVQRCGFRELGEVPKAVWNTKAGKSLPGIFFYYDLQEARDKKGDIKDD